MTALGEYQDDEYWPEFGTLIVRDVGGPYEESGPFGQHGSQVQPCGTIARTGNGWLEGSAGDGPHVVRLELHDSAPPQDSTEWAGAVEIPYRSRSGAVGLGYVTGGFCGDIVQLAGAGPYRVRVTCRPCSEDNELEELWLLRFWPAEPQPPRWFARRRPAVRSDNPGSNELLGSELADLLWVVWLLWDQTGGATLEALRQWGAQHGRGAEWLDQPPRALTLRLPHEMNPAEVARQVGAAAPATLAEMLDVFVAAGVLVKDNGSYRWPEVVPNAEDVLDLPPERTAQLIAGRNQDRFCSFAADLVSVAMWNGSTQTLAALAQRTLAPEADVRAALAWAQRAGWLRIAGSLDETFTMTC